jgi:hypothetical protein
VPLRAAAADPPFWRDGFLAPPRRRSDGKLGAADPMPDPSPHRVSRADAVAVALLAAVAVWVGMANWRYSYDDAYITFRMAAHFAQGQGFVYNPGEWHLGSTAAFYGLLLGALGRFAGPDRIPVLAGIVSAFSLLATAVSLYALGWLEGHARGRATGLAAGVFVLASPMLFVTYGGEMPFVLALVTGAFLAVEADRPRLAATLAAVAVLSRPDGVIALGLVVAAVAHRRRRVPWIEAGIAAGILLPFAALAWHAYGSPLPSTLGAKLAQRDSGLWSTFGRGLIDWLRLFLWNDQGPNLGFAPVKPPTLWVWTAIGAVAVWRERRFRPLLAWCVAFVAAYTWLRAPFYHWYAAPAVLGLAIAAGSGLATLLELAAPLRRWPEAIIAAAAAAALAISIAPIAALPRTSRLNENVRLYIETGRWLATNTQRTSRVGYYEIGYIGFYGDRPMIDALGLIDPKIAPAVVAHDFARAFRDGRPDYILEKPGAGLNTFLAEPWFAQEYRLEAELHVGREAIRIHRRK